MFITIIIKYIIHFACICIKKKSKSKHKVCHDNHDSGWAKNEYKWTKMGIDECKRVHWGVCIWADTEMRSAEPQGTRIECKHDRMAGKFPGRVNECMSE